MLIHKNKKKYKSNHSSCYLGINHLNSSHAKKIKWHFQPSSTVVPSHRLYILSVTKNAKRFFSSFVISHFFLAVVKTAFQSRACLLFPLTNSQIELSLSLSHSTTKFCSICFNQVSLTFWFFSDSLWYIGQVHNNSCIFISKDSFLWMYMDHITNGYCHEKNLMPHVLFVSGFGLVWFGLVLWYINHCRSFNAKSFLYIYIKYMISKHSL